MELPVVDAGTSQPAGHVHSWQVLAAELSQLPQPILFGSRQATRVLLRCRDCGWPETTTLAGCWTIEQLA